MEDKRRATAADVAAAASVSRSTVSYILNGSNLQTFAPETVARVQAVATELSYTPHAAARALRRGKSGVVLLALQELPAGGNLAKLLTALTDAVRATNRSLVTLTLRPDNRLVDTLRDISPQALLEVLPLPEADMAAAQAANIPVISVTAPLQHLDRAAAALQVQHLVALGHRRLGVVSSTETWMRPFASSRLGAVLEAAVELGLSTPEVITIASPIDDRVLGEVGAQLRGWAKAREPVTAVCCFNDLFAGLVVAAARSVDLDVSADLSVVGIDDEPLGGLLNPALTSVRYDFSAIGDEIRDRLRHLLDGGTAPPPADTSDALELVQRDSTRRLARP